MEILYAKDIILVKTLFKKKKTFILQDYLRLFFKLGVCQNFVNKLWYHYNDLNLNIVSEPERFINDQIERQPYILFYSKGKLYQKEIQQNETNTENICLHTEKEESKTFFLSKYYFIFN